MNLLSTFFLALSLSADSFAVAASKGASLRRPKPSEAIKTGLVFGSIQAVMPIMGWGLGASASHFITVVDHWIAFFILVALGLKMLMDSAKKLETHQKPSRHKFWALVLAGLGTSIDAMGVGASLAFINVDIWMTATVIGITTFFVAGLGIMVGHKIGRKVGKGAEVAGGIILIGLGTMILLQHISAV